MQIYRLFYSSDGALIGAEAHIRKQIDEIVVSSVARNAERGITGAIMQTHSGFSQVLEGPLPALEDIFEQICRDIRHRSIDLLELIPIDNHAFSQRALALVTPNRAIGRLISATDLSGGYRLKKLSVNPLFS